MKPIKALFCMIFAAGFVSCDMKQEVYALVSYGYGDNAENAKKSYLSLTPNQLSSHLCCNPFTTDTLLSSIFSPRSYVQDLFNNLAKNIGNNPFVAIGHSRGAEMLIHFVGEHNPGNLQALVLFATPISVGQAVKSKMFKNPEAAPTKTLDSIKKIKNKELPIMLFHQEKDKLVTFEHSKILCKALKSHGFENVYLGLLNDGGHNHLINPAGYHVLQSFYRYHHIPYDSNSMLLTDVEFLKFKQ